MTSILTNNGAMVALQTLKSINSNLESTQNEISTGKKVANGQGQRRDLGGVQDDGSRRLLLQGDLRQPRRGGIDRVHGA